MFLVVLMLAQPIEMPSERWRLVGRGIVSLFALGVLIRWLVSRGDDDDPPHEP